MIENKPSIFQENKERVPLDIVYKKDMLEKIKQHPDKFFLIAMRGPQGSGKDFTAFSLAREAGWSPDQVISTDEYYYMDSDELAVVSGIIQKTGTQEDVVNQSEKIDMITPDELKTIQEVHRKVLLDISEREKDPEKYLWTP